MLAVIVFCTMPSGFIPTVIWAGRVYEWVGWDWLAEGVLSLPPSIGAYAGGMVDRCLEIKFPLMAIYPNGSVIYARGESGEGP